MASDPRDGTFRTPDERGPVRLDRAIKDVRKDHTWGEVRDWIARGKVRVDGELAVDPARPVRAGAEVRIEMESARLEKRGALPAFDRARVLHQDRDVIVVDKPAGLSTVPWEDELDALDQRVAGLVGRAVRVVQRLDRDTSGVLMFALTEAGERSLQQQLRVHSVLRSYLAIAHGEVATATIRTFLAENRGDGLRGSVSNRAIGKEAITHVEPVEALRGATLVRCRLETGRTHQIRIHLAEKGHMLLGERGYVRDHQGPVLPAPRILLHAQELGFDHPTTGRSMHFTSPLPEDFEKALAAMRS